MERRDNWMLPDWEYAEFDMPTEDQDRVFLGWLREGWELVGVHPKGKGQRKPMPVAIVRREMAQPRMRGN
jgi:hypothetical protein